MFKPTSIPQLSPYFTVKDGNKSIKFYTDAFGFTVVDLVKGDDGEPQHVSMEKQEAYIMFSPEGSYGSTKKAPISLGVSMPVSMYIYCENTDQLYQQAITNGAISLIEPNDSFWGDRFCAVQDIDGYEWWFATLLKK